MSKKADSKSKMKTKKTAKTIKKFTNWSAKVNKVVGSPHWFAFSVILILIWVPSGLLIGFTEIWHLLINTTTTILTFLMMSLLHASQSEWERKMERIQDREKEALRAINKELEQAKKDIRKIYKKS